MVKEKASYGDFTGINAGVIVRCAGYESNS